MFPLRARTSIQLGLLLVVISCSDKDGSIADTGRSPAAVPATRPVNATNWDLDAGPVMVMSMAEGESVSVVLPQATDSTFPPRDSLAVPSDLRVDLFGRAGKIASNILVSPVTNIADADECQTWPAARTTKTLPGWRVGFPSGRVGAIALDSIAGMSSADSAALATQIVQVVSSLPLSTDSEFRGLPFRVRAAYTFRAEATAAVIADVVRSVNEEANPRLEHFFVVGERPVNSTAGYRIGFFTRTDGREEEADITELLAVVLIGPARRPAIVVNIHYDQGGQLGLLQRTAPGQWRFRWRSAYTGC